MWGVGVLRSWVAIAAMAGVVVLIPGRASATISGPCTATVSGVDVTSDHDSAGSAVHVNYRSTVPYEGQASGGQTVASAKVHLQIQDLTVRTFPAKTNGSMWSSTADVKKYAWAGVGLYRVRGEAALSGGPGCTGTAYICVDGRSPFTTAAGIAGAVLGAVGLLLLLRGLFVRRSRSRGELAGRFAVSGVLGGIAAPVLLQQFCVLPITEIGSGAILGGGIVGLAVLGALLGGAKTAAMAPVSATRAAAPPVVPPPVAPRRQEEDVVYRFVPPQDACNACRSHAEHMTYGTAGAAEADRAHPRCHCEIASRPSQKGEIVAHFSGGRTSHDDRSA